jgi:hypothetical protein
MTRKKLIIVVAAVVLIMQAGSIVIAIVASSNAEAVATRRAQASQRSTTRDQVAACMRQGQRSVVLANIFRVQAKSDQIVSGDNSLSPLTRRAKAAEALADVAGLRIIDASIDRSLWMTLESPVDRKAVRTSHFTCVKAFATGSPHGRAQLRKFTRKDIELVV